MLFAGTTSPDGLYAVGWTLRPRHDGVPAVDWLTWDEENPSALLARYPWDREDNGDPPYELVDCVVDLRSKRLLILPSEAPNYPQKNRGHLDVVWGPPARGERTRFALVQNDARFYTENLWLVSLNESLSGMNQHDLTKILKEAVTGRLRRRPGARADDYGMFFPVHRNGYAVDQDVAFKATSVVVPFEAGIPKEDAGEVTGVVTVNLARAEVVGLSVRQAKSSKR